jgi:hypothetical protein
MTIIKDLRSAAEAEIEKVNKVIIELKSDNKQKLSKKLRSLSYCVHAFSHWVDEQLRIQIEAEAERKVKAMMAAGFSFDSVTVNNTRFIISSGGELQKYDPRIDSDDLPF